MAITDVDLSGNTFTLTPMVMTDTAQVLLESIISNIQYDKQKFEDMTGEAQGKMNEIIGVVNNLQDGTDIDIEELSNKIEAILALQSEAGDESFVGLFTKLFTELNRREEILVWTLPVTDTVDGKVGIDLSAYGFNTVDDYEVKAEVRTHGLKNLSASFEKVSAAGGMVTIRDNDHISFATNANSFFAANATDAKVYLTILLSKTATPIFGTVTEVDGDVDEFGTPLIAPVVKVDATVNTAGDYLFNGLQGILPSTVLSMVNSDTTANFTINATDTVDAFNIVSDAPVKVNGSITVYKVVNGVNAPSRTFNYASPFPQINIGMISVGSTGGITFTSSGVLAGGLLDITVDGTTPLAQLVLDAVGGSTTTEQNALLANHSQHTLTFTVTKNSLQSVVKTFTFTIEADGNLSEL